MTVSKRVKPNLSLEDILRVLRERMPELREQYHVKSLAVFGSYARGEQTRKSDIDVLVEFDKTPTLFGFVELQDHLADALGARVDLVMRTGLKPRIGERILSEAVPV